MWPTYIITLCNAFTMILVFYAGEIAGIVIAGLLILLLIPVILCFIVVICYCFKRNKLKVMPKFMSLSDIYVIEQTVIVIVYTDLID